MALCLACGWLWKVKRAAEAGFWGSVFAVCCCTFYYIGLLSISFNARASSSVATSLFTASFHLCSLRLTFHYYCTGGTAEEPEFSVVGRFQVDF